MSPTCVPELYRRAADWFESIGLLEEAMKHAHAGGDLKRTGELLQRQLLLAYRGGRIATMRAWFDRLGDAAEHDPGLAIAWAWVSALTGDPAAADRWLDISERLPALGTVPARDRIAGLLDGVRPGDDDEERAGRDAAGRGVRRSRGAGNQPLSIGCARFRRARQPALR